MTKNILLSPACFGPVEYFVHLNNRHVTIEKHGNYARQTYRNRYLIMAANAPLTLSVPVEKGKHPKVPDKEVKIAYHTPWQNNHWRSIVSAYNSSPFFEFYRDEIEPLFTRKYTFLFDFNMATIDLMIELLNIEANITFTEAYKTHPGENILDRRESIHPKRKPMEPNAYFYPEPYKQVFDDRHGFIPNLSILDLLFNKGPESQLVLEQCAEG